MITAVDTNILIDILSEHPVFAMAAWRAIKDSQSAGVVCSCDLVWTETAAGFKSSTVFIDSMEQLQIEFSPCTVETCLIAGQIWNNYRAVKNKNTLRRIAADFLIGAHALNQCDLLLTRDSQFYRKYFKKLKILNPTD